MKQILQNMGNGETTIVEAPAPKVQAGNLVIRTTHSLISAGTERMLVDFGKASMLDKARQQPEKVKMVLDKVRTEGLLTTIDAVRSKLDQPLPLGYCNAGVVLEVGAGVEGFAVGDRVVSNGPHADLVRVPKHLCARIPDGVNNEEAAFTVLASIGLQGIRLAQPTLGESVVVVGLGLIGLATAQLLKANGCRVLGIDFDASKLALARQFGIETCNPAQGQDPVAFAMAFTQGAGVDAVIVTASTKSSDPISQAARMSRKRGRIVLVGVTGLELNRSEFYEKELTFQVSCSYGPGRYDPDYEQGGNDYPVGFVRWTEQRNFAAVLDMMAAGHLNVASLISHRFPFDDAIDAYQVLSADKSALGIVLQYPDVLEAELRVKKVALQAASPSVSAAPGRPVLGVVGAGNYASRVLLPAFKKAGGHFGTIVTSGGVSGVHHGKKLGFESASTELDDVMTDASVNTVVIATRHDTHAGFVVRALRGGKHVFVEKPLALTIEQLERVQDAYADAQSEGASCLLMVGFNRRFSPLVMEMKRALGAIRQPKVFVYTVNAGAIPANHWTQDMAVGGGRIIGEACHFIDLLRHLAGAPIIDASIRCIESQGDIVSDKASITLSFADGSLGTIHYLANGGKAFPKERLEVFAGDGVMQLENYRALRGFDASVKNMKLWRQDKGQDACAAAFLDAISKGQASPIPYEELVEVARVTIELGLQAS
ncbi:bi-domain-containing oxidoreductase [Pandoraea cepalis]|uniref:L-threonine 3-dehydrogenase n=1 Tax=Pandoraea cepalis TaxID=2508294 RepID=A0A5E4XF91_9BURK|nr:bi-domain-containing oxidoreductase [Pandoraea cepalis]VVE35049.1 L-threonine 3-dehydrogenase [Pandoraea cepalis]